MRFAEQTSAIKVIGRFSLDKMHVSYDFLTINNFYFV